MSGRPISIDTADWSRFDPNSPADAACERERMAFTQYTLKRLRKIDRFGGDQAAIWIGGIMAMTQMVYAIHENRPTEDARERLHQIFDFAWLQCAAMSLDESDVQ